MSLDYTKKVIELFKHPKNVGVIKNPDGVGTQGGAVLFGHAPATSDDQRLDLSAFAQGYGG